MPHFYEGSRKSSRGNRRCVSMPSRAYASFLLHCQKQTLVLDLDPCQCPHGLVPHFYRQPLSSVVSGQVIVSMPSRASTSFLLVATIFRWKKLYWCQCPLGLVPHFYINSKEASKSVTVCQCPLGLVPHFYSTPSKT